MKMKAADKERWLTALRSGEYEQVAGTLCNGTGYCCLGVLEEVLDGQVEKRNNDEYFGSPTLDFLTRHNIEVETRAGDPVHENGSMFPLLDYRGTYSRLMELNDEEETDEIGEPIAGTHVYSFGYIANYIEENVETYD